MTLTQAIQHYCQEHKIHNTNTLQITDTKDMLHRTDNKDTSYTTLT